MPAHFTHAVFAQQMVSCPREMLPFLYLGAQGPDIFLHNRRSVPSGLAYGIALHKEGFGRFTGLLAANAAVHGPESACAYYAAGFITHGILDRKTHPFINYHAGWIVPGKKSTLQYQYCHPFFERIIDTLVVRHLFGTGLLDFAFARKIDCGPNLPDTIREAVAASLAAAFPNRTGTDRELETKIENAYSDTIGFYRFSDPANRKNLRAVIRMKPDPVDLRRISALLYHKDYPGHDYLNLDRGTWYHPHKPEKERRDSFPDLFEAAKDAARPVLHIFGKLLKSPYSREYMNDLQTALGDHSLSDDDPVIALPGCIPKDRLPLEKILAEFELKTAEEFGISAGRHKK